MIELDGASLLVHAKGTDRLADLETELAAHGLTLDLASVPDVTVAAWLETGAQGARSAWLDPADHLVAGITTSKFSIHPAPRRAVGPDLLSMVLGLRSELVRIESVWLRVHRKGVARPVAQFVAQFDTGDASDDSRVTRDEQRLFDAIKTAFFR